MPTGRIRRTAKVGGLLGGEVARAYATKAANLVRSGDDRSAANGRRRLEATDHVVEVLGQMKGPAMKIGQMASILNLGGLPPEEVGSSFRPSWASCATTRLKRRSRRCAR